jgi:DNA-directed RNA polymerase specialized sigma24 family protein
VTPKTSAADATQTGTHGSTAFATTHWSMIARAASHDPAEGRAALEELCRIYWYPLYGFARRRGATPADAEDLTQGFLADLLARGAVAQADANRGRFRTFLLNSFDNFRSHERARAGAIKRGGGREVVSLDALQAAETRFCDEPATTETPERIFDRKWALSLIEVAMAAVRREYEKTGKLAVFDALKPALLGGRGEIGYVEIGRRLGMTEGAIKIAALRLRQCFAGHFRAEVTKTVLDPADTDDEIRHLLAAVSA